MLTVLACVQVLQQLGESDSSDSRLRLRVSKCNTDISMQT